MEKGVRENIPSKHKKDDAETNLRRLSCLYLLNSRY